MVRTTSRVAGLLALVVLAAGYAPRSGVAGTGAAAEAEAGRRVLTVTIRGGTSSLPNTICTWAARPSGGVAPYTYEWTQYGGWGYAHDDNLYDAAHSNSFSLSVKVTDATGAVAIAHRSVTVGSNVIPCSAY